MFGNKTRIMVTLCLPATLALVVACDRPAVTYVDEGNTYTNSSAEDLARDMASDHEEDVATGEAATRRRDALIELRSLGTDPSELANLLTELFPDEEQSVPFYAELATFDGSEAWIVVESWGANDGVLGSTRLWVFDRRAGTVLFATAVN